MDDDQLLTLYVNHASPDVFAQIVHRHIDLVYSCALRQTRDRDLSDDIAQAVFLILSRRAASIRHRQLLTGWLVRTTRYAAMNALKYQSRRRHHEQQAAAMTPSIYTASPTTPEITTLLDEALSKLSLKDCSAITLRYFQGKTVHDVSLQMGVTEHAAQKRISRALARMRGILARNGIHSPADALESALSQGLCIAPLTLSSIIAAQSPTNTTMTIARTTQKTMTMIQAKLIATTCAAVLLVGGSFSTLILRFQSSAQASADTPAPAAPTATTNPTKFSNAQLEPGFNAGEYSSTIAQDVRRTQFPAALFQSAVPMPKTFGNEGFTIPADDFRGKRIRLTAWVKTENVDRWAGLHLMVGQEGGRVLSMDDMGSRPIHGTTDWKQYESVADVPDDATSIAFGVALYHTGKVWTDDYEIAIVSPDTPTTDDTHWHHWSWRTNAYNSFQDKSVTRNNQPTTCVASNADYRPGDYCYYDRANRHIEPYVGKKVRVTAWIKSEGVSGLSGISIHVVGPSFRQLIKPVPRPIRGTTDWKKYEATADVPDGAQSIFPGLVLQGKGKMWLDDLTMEIVEP